MSAMFSTIYYSCLNGDRREQQFVRHRKDAVEFVDGLHDGDHVGVIVADRHAQHGARAVLSEVEVGQRGMLGIGCCLEVTTRWCEDENE